MYEHLSAKEKIIKAMQDNLFAHMLFFPEHADCSTVVKARGMVIVDGHVNNDCFNLVCNVQLDEDALDAIESAVNYFKREGAPFAWWVSPDDKPADLAELLPFVGLRLIERQIGMYAVLEDQGVEQGILRVERVTDATQFDDFADVMARGMEDDTFAEYYERMRDFPFAPEDYEQLYVGYLDEEPVSCGILTLHSNVAGIHGLVTVPEHRNKGFGSAMMHELLMRAQLNGYAIAVLQADQSMSEFYERFGFEPLCEFNVFVG